ncbi:Uncharacterized protein BC141101_06026 [Bacillus toyonensis]|nr:MULTISPECIES: hypothetical protein [Bacillus cereus group]EEL31234.1 hypothetical protein bcere0019_55990 [Bacillus cereus Rock3-28]EEL37272.1 hypothetical protein bcere0020_53350 [Bacillus cereus Rock3-29]EJV90183.1 hypothetical protein IGI_05443 [Bacillus toyonensis]EOP46224.1 hypothetical protein IKI_05178 [Bacillus toyonensis]MDR4974813.1 hypothetical protein [Bacillus toyonensis]
MNLTFQMEKLEEVAAPKKWGKIWNKVKDPVMDFGEGFINGFL